VHVLLGVPTDADPRDDYVMDKGAYVLSYNRRRHQANWVAWRVTEEDLGVVSRSESFRPDEELPFGFYKVQPSDYRRSGYDRGHLCPSSHRTRDQHANSLTFLMSNMQPQLHTLNAGAWKSLETYERNLAAKDGKDVYIVAGALFEANARTIGANIAIPSAAYRVTLVLPRGAALNDVSLSTPVFAVQMPNDVSVQSRKWHELTFSVDEVERNTGYDFLSALPDDLEAQLESKQP
jgi:endonuclease G